MQVRTRIAPEPLAVTLTPQYPDEFPLEVVFQYERNDAGVLDCIDVQLQQADTGQNVAVTPPVMRDLASRFKVLDAIARAHLGDNSGVEQVKAVRRRRELSPGFLRVVANRYRERVAAGVSPVQALAREEGVSRRTAANWVDKARTAGYLEPASRGRSSKT